jgi:hypothetical protein
MKIRIVRDGSVVSVEKLGVKIQRSYSDDAAAKLVVDRLRRSRWAMKAFMGSSKRQSHSEG